MGKDSFKVFEEVSKWGRRGERYVASSSNEQEVNGLRTKISTKLNEIGQEGADKQRALFMMDLVASYKSQQNKTKEEDAFIEDRRAGTKAALSGLKDEESQYLTTLVNEYDQYLTGLERQEGGHYAAAQDRKVLVSLVNDLVSVPSQSPTEAEK